MVLFQPQKRIWPPVLIIWSLLHQRSVLYAGSTCVPIVSPITQSNASKTCVPQHNTGVIILNLWRRVLAQCSVRIGGHN